MHVSSVLYKICGNISGLLIVKIKLRCSGILYIINTYWTTKHTNKEIFCRSVANNARRQWNVTFNVSVVPTEIPSTKFVMHIQLNVKWDNGIELYLTSVD